MKFRTIFVVVGCLIAIQLIDVSFAPAQATGPLREWLQNQNSNKQDDGYGAVFNNLTCAKLARLARRWANTGSAEPTLTASYGPDPAQSLDVYAPHANGGAPAPILVMVHGGAWCVGDKRMDRVVINKINRWVPKGFLFVSVNYRMLPDHVDVMTQAGDVASAIAYVQAHAAQWNGNPSAMIVMGHSAGAHLVSLLSTQPDLAANYGAKPWLGTVSLDSGAINVSTIMETAHPAFYDDAFGKDPSYWAQTSPFQHISAHSLPWLGVCSTKRMDSCPQAHAYSDEAAKHGIKAGVLEENLNHGEINAQLGKNGAYTIAVESFMKSLNPDVKSRLQ